MKALPVVLGILLVLTTVLSMNGSATVSQPVVQGTIYFADGSPASGATVTVALNGLVLNTTSSDGAGHYYVKVDIEYSVPMSLAVNASMGNQTNETLGTVVDGVSTYNVDVHMNAPPRYNVTILARDINTHVPIASAFTIVNEDAYGSNSEVFSGYTNSTGQIRLNLAIDGNAYRVTCLKSGTIERPEGYPSVGVVRNILQEMTITIDMGTVPIPDYNLTVQVKNGTSGPAIAGAHIDILPGGNRYPTVASGVTDGGGSAMFTLSSASYWIITAVNGYLSNEKLVSLDADQLVTIEMVKGKGTTATPTFILPMLALVALSSILMAWKNRRMKSPRKSRKAYPMSLPGNLPADKPLAEMTVDDFLPASVYNEWERAAYKDRPEGGIVRSSRTNPNPFNLKPGIWRYDDTFNSVYGHWIEQLVLLPVADLEPSEDSRDRMGDVDRYAEWGTQAPPIETVQGDKGAIMIVNGHRRWLAAKKRGDKFILAWYSPTMPVPDGATYAGGKIRQGTALTYEHRNDWEPGWYPAKEGRWW